MDIETVETFIVAGPPHTGTSLTTGTLHKLGIPMGEVFLNDGKFEDQVFLLEKDPDVLYDTIWTRNHKYQRWGFKYPHAWGYMPEIARNLLRPKVILTYRSLHSYFERYKNELPENLPLSYLKAYGFWGTFLEVYRWDLLVVDYETAIKSKSYLVEKLTRFCNISPSEEQIRDAKNFNTFGTGYNRQSS